MAAAAVLGVASTAARISTLRALLVAAGSFGVVVELGAFVFEAPRAVVGLDVDSVGLLLGRKIAALLEKTHVVLERGYHVLVGHLATALARLLGLFTVRLEPPPADFEAPATFVAALLLDGVAGVLKGVNTGTGLDAESSFCCLQE